ncbi:O-antigen polymerase [Desulfocucumis palustris]|uniref:O-antigen polymerase n=1 Tax=Desulfocucumis palustris TaxID=1898651 RepID=A0A2L2XGV7_9FIRM|nr:O-antigen polymerase [Desulfocucumis palustris]
MEVVRNSLLYKFIVGIYAFFSQYGRGSLTLGFFTGAPYYTTQKAVTSSALIKLAAVPAGILAAPFAAAGSLLRRSIPGSLSNNINLPAFIENSLAWRAAAGIRVETALWLIVLYPVADYLLRNISPLAALSGSWDELLFLFILLAWPLQMAVRGGIYWRHTMLDIPIVVYMGIILFLYFLRSPDATLAAEGARVYIQYLLWYFVAANLLINRRQFDALITGIIGTAALLALIGILQYIIGVEMPAGWVDQAEAGVRTRVFSIVTSPNVLGSFLILIIPVTISRIINLKGNLPGRLFYAACLAAMLACLVFTYSRGAWLALAGGLALYSLLYSPKMLLVMVAGGLGVLKFVPGIGSRMSYMFSSAYLDSSARAGRLARWSMGLDRLKENLWLGEGFGRFGGAVATRRIPGSFYVDNFYLKTAVESGLIGLLALLWLLLNTIRLGFATLRRLADGKARLLAAGILAGLTGVMLHNGVENIFEVPMMSAYFWFMAGMLAAAPEIENADK